MAGRGDDVRATRAEGCKLRAFRGFGFRGERGESSPASSSCSLVWVGKALATPTKGVASSRRSIIVSA